MLKPLKLIMQKVRLMAATFGWLCVETLRLRLCKSKLDAATFGWLCVETVILTALPYFLRQPPSGGCVLKHCKDVSAVKFKVAATFGWLCVETGIWRTTQQISKCSHLRVAVC
mgnify:CR=1 FL=1